jgi:ribonuclease E
MPRRMLINATHAGELRVAVLDGAQIENYQVEVSEQGLERGNIYRGIISGIQPGLNAAFIDYGAERNGFLAIQDVVPEAYYRAPKNARRPEIDEVLERGMPIVVQVQKEADGQKGSSLTTNLSLAGRYLVLTPFDPTRGVSRKVEDDETRRLLRQAAGSLDVPKGSGFIVRTNALDQNKATLAKDLATLLRLWKRIEAEAIRGDGIKTLYDDQDLLLRALRDHLDASIDEILVDEDAAYEKAEQYAHAFLPRSKTRLLRYAEKAPLFERFDVEHQIDRIFERHASLPSGGSIVIDRTEALTAVDVNSGKATRAANQAETALQTNLEAAREVARQLRLRDIGGLVVVDFIDMRAPKAQRKVEKELKEAMKSDRARFTTGRISPNGLLEINRQRVQQALDRRTHTPCAICEGSGRVPAPETLYQSLLRRIEARAAIAPIRGVKLSLPPELAEGFRASRGPEIAALEAQFDMQIEIVPSRRLHSTAQEFEWLDRPRDNPGPLPAWTLTGLPGEVRWHAPLLATAADPTGDAALTHYAEPADSLPRAPARPVAARPARARPAQARPAQARRAPARPQAARPVKEQPVQARPARPQREGNRRPRRRKDRGRRGVRGAGLAPSTPAPANASPLGNEGSVVAADSAAKPGRGRRRRPRRRGRKGGGPGAGGPGVGNGGSAAVLEAPPRPIAAPPTEFE